jgi:DNA-binding response OmpR family regulator
VSRFSPEGADVYVFADVTVDFFKTEITRGGEEISITPKEFKTLKFLARNAHRVISQDEFFDKAWGYENYPSTRTVDNHMLRLPQKLESDPSHPWHLLTVHGVGYEFCLKANCRKNNLLEDHTECQNTHFKSMTRL